MDDDEVGVEIEAPQTFFPNEEEDPSIVEGGGRDENNNDNNDGVPQQQKTWYSKTIGKVAILLLAVFAVCLAIGYGSGYGINEKIISNRNKAAAISSAKNGNFETYDGSPTSAAKASKNGGSGAAKSAKSTGPTGAKSAKAVSCVSILYFIRLYSLFVCFI